MKPLIKTFGSILGMSFIAQSANAAQFDNPLAIGFTNHCLGRYQIDLPVDLKLVESYYYDGVISLNTYALDDQDNIGVLRGKQRIKQWQNYVETKRTKSSKVATKYIIQDVEPLLKIQAYYSDNRTSYDDPNAAHKFTTFFFKDYPEQALGIVIDQAKHIFIPRNESRYAAIYKDKLAELKFRAERVHYQLWPHNKPGVCLDKEFSVVFDKMAPSENYHMQFYNGKNSRLTFRSSVFGGPETSNAELQKAIKEDLGPLSLFASSKTKVANRQGRLFVSDDRYSDTGRRFRWISTDDQVNSISHARLEIEGSFDMDDYPDLKPMNGTDMIVGVLKFIQIRDNGMVY